MGTVLFQMSAGWNCENGKGEKCGNFREAVEYQERIVSA